MIWVSWRPHGRSRWYGWKVLGRSDWMGLDVSLTSCGTTRGSDFSITGAAGRNAAVALRLDLIAFDLSDPHRMSDVDKAVR